MKPSDSAINNNAPVQPAISFHQRLRLRVSAWAMKKLLAYFSGDAVLLARLGTVELLLGNLEEADRRFKTSLDIDSNQPNIQFRRGTALQDLGRNLDALRCYNQAISLRPDFDEALHCREQLVQRLNKKPLSSATKSSRSRKQGSNDAESNYEKGLRSFEAGKFDKALANFDRAIALKPDYAEAHCARGVSLKESNRLNEALASLDRAIALSPDLVEAYHNRGVVLQGLSRLEEALASLDRAIGLSPDLAEAHNNRGIILKDLSRLDEALASLDRAIALKPDYAEAHCGRGVVLIELSRLDEALASLDRAIALSPGLVEAYNNRGVVLQGLGRLNEALASFDDAIALSPGFAQAHKNRGNILEDLYRLDEALTSVDRAIALQPDYVGAHNQRGACLVSLDRWDEALESVDRAIELDPSVVESHINRGYVLQDLNRLDEALASYHRAIALKRDSVTAYNNLLFLGSFHGRSGPAEHLEQARRFDTIVTERAKAYTQWRVGAEGDNDKRLRVGLVSGDFWSHSVGFFLESVVAHLDPKRIELVAYATNSKEDALTARIKPYFAAWNTLVRLNDEAAAKVIHADGIHILIDLAGHTAYNRLPVFAWKPAPVQASWLGFCATTGVSAIDYYIADNWTLPPSMEGQFTETVWRLPESYLCLSRPEMDVAVTEPPALTAGHVTFGSFNNSYKMTEEVIALWARILKAIPGSRLFLKAAQFKEDSVRERILVRYAAHGISADRLQFEGHMADRGAHLAAYNQVDIGLDPFPYNGVTTTVEALWMGVPVLTLAGERFLSRQGVGILTNTGLSDWIACDADELVAKALAFAGDLDRLTALRTGLRQQVLISPLFDAPRFARHFEDACFGMWHEKMA